MQSVKITSDSDNRADFKKKLLDKVEVALTPPAPTVEVETEEVEILDKYATWVPARFAINADDILPGPQKDEDYIPQGELDAREAVKSTLLNKVEDSLTPPVVEAQPEVVIVEKYSSWVPAGVVLGPEETLSPEFKITEASISPWEAEKKAIIEAALLNKAEIEAALLVAKPVETPVRVKPVTKPVEIIEKYAKGTLPRPLDDEPFFPEPTRVESSSRDFNPLSELDKRTSTKSNLLNRIEGAIAPPVVDAEPTPIEIIEKYSNWGPARIAWAPEAEILPEPKKTEPILLQGEMEKQAAIEHRLMVEAAQAQIPVVEPEPAPIEIIEKYSDWVPARIALELENDSTPVAEKLGSFLPHSELEKRADIKNRLLSKVEASLAPAPVEVEPEPAEIIEKYTQWTPVRVALNTEDDLIPEFQKDKPFMSQGEQDKKAAIEHRLMVEAAQTLIPVVEAEPEPIEIIEKYAEWSSARIALKPEDELLPEFQKDTPFMPQGEQEKKVAIEHRLAVEAAQALLPAPEKPEPAPIEIVEKHAQWVPARVAQPSEDYLTPEFQKDEPFLSQGEQDKKAAIEHRLLVQAEQALLPAPVEPEPEPIEIIEKYSNWTPSRIVLEPEDELLPEFQQDEPFMHLGEQEKKAAIEHRLMVEAAQALIPVVEAEPVPIEIIEKYSNWTPAHNELEPEELLPEFKKEDSFIPHREVEKRADIKQDLLSKVESSLAPPVEVEVIEPAPIEIVERHSKWVPAGLALGSEDLLPEFQREGSFIPQREIEKRADIKNRLLSKVESSLAPTVEVEEAVKPIEILDKFAGGIPQHSPKEVEPVFPEARRILNPTILATDVAKRVGFKDKLVKKLDSLAAVETAQEVEIVGYSERPVNSYGFDFNEINIPDLHVSEIQESIVDFQPVVEDAVIPVLLLPENYEDLDERALYGILIRDAELRHTSETANLALDVLAGRSSKTVEFKIVKHKFIKPTFINPKKSRKKIPIVLNPTEPVDSPSKVEGLQPVANSTVEVKEPGDNSPGEVKKLELVDFVLPDDWQSVPLSTLRIDLLTTGATPEQVDAKLASMVESNSNPVRRTTTKTQVEEPLVNLPEGFKAWKTNSQYIYLTKELLLTPERANEIIWDSTSATEN